MHYVYHLCCYQTVIIWWQGVYGAGAHTDYNAMTVLATNDTPGLQIHTAGIMLFNTVHFFDGAGACTDYSGLQETDGAA